MEAWEREHHRVLQDAYALPPAIQYEIAEALLDHLGLQIGRDILITKQLQARLRASADMKTAADWLELPDRVPPGVDDYRRAADALGLMSVKQVITAWDRFSFAQDFHAGRWVPPSPAQRAHQRATQGKKRTHETYLAGLRKWQTTPGTMSRKASQYDEFVPDYNQRRPPDEPPLVKSSGIMNVFIGLAFEEVVAGAMGELDPYELMEERAQAALAHALEKNGVLTSSEAAALLGYSRSHFDDARREPGFPQPVALIARARVWDAEGIRAYRDGQPVPQRSPFERQHELLSTGEVAAMHGTTQATIAVYLYRRARGRGGFGLKLPEPLCRVGSSNVWLRAEVEARIATHGRIGRSPRSG
jgi:predicted DNA-binding transcriptional regulator AlpA